MSFEFRLNGEKYWIDEIDDGEFWWSSDDDQSKQGFPSILEAQQDAINTVMQERLEEELELEQKWESRKHSSEDDRTDAYLNAYWKGSRGC